MMCLDTFHCREAAMSRILWSQILVLAVRRTSNNTSKLFLSRFWRLLHVQVLIFFALNCTRYNLLQKVRQGQNLSANLFPNDFNSLRLFYVGYCFVFVFCSSSSCGITIRQVRCQLTFNTKLACFI